jgi:hypothetical protein
MLKTNDENQKALATERLLGSSVLYDICRVAEATAEKKVETVEIFSRFFELRFCS